MHFDCSCEESKMSPGSISEHQFFLGDMPPDLLKCFACSVLCTLYRLNLPDQSKVWCHRLVHTQYCWPDCSIRVCGYSMALKYERIMQLSKSTQCGYVIYRIHRWNALRSCITNIFDLRHTSTIFICFLVNTINIKLCMQSWTASVLIVL